MPRIVQKLSYFKISVPNKPGEGARILRALRDEGINLVGFSGFPRGRRSQLDFIPENAATFKAAAKKAGLKLRGEKNCFIIQGEDRPGAMAEILSTLAQAKVNVTALDGVSAGEGRYGAILWVKPAATAKAAKALGLF